MNFRDPIILWMDIKRPFSIDIGRIDGKSECSARRHTLCMQTISLIVADLAVEWPQGTRWMVAGSSETPVSMYRSTIQEFGVKLYLDRSPQAEEFAVLMLMRGDATMD